jgi:iron complex outermembrane receptor protein
MIGKYCRRQALRLGVAGGALVFATSVFAQAKAPAATDAAAAQVAEVVVTAEKRSQSLQSVPTAVTAITAKTAAAIGITDVQSIQSTVPGLEFPRFFNGSTPTLRGIGTNSGIGAAESVVAMYVDDVYIAAPAGTTFSLNNISQIEVLKGPQGTLYGRNAMGGVVDIKTRDPSASPSADVSLGYGAYDTLTGAVYGNLALGDKLFADLALAGSDQRLGWGKNLYDGAQAFKELDAAARTKWLWKPDQDTSLTLTADYNRSKYNSGIAMRPIVGALFPNGQTYQGYYNVNENPLGTTNTTQGGVSLKLDHDFGFARLVDIVGYRLVRSYNVADEDQTVDPSQTFHYDDNRDTLTEELRLISPGGGRFHWIAGLFYFDDTSNLNPFKLTGTAVPAPFTELEETFRIKTRSYAAFGQGTADLPYETHLTLGARYTYDEVSLAATEALNDFIVDTGQGHFNDNAFTYKVSLGKDLTRNIMAYAGYSTGFKGGTFNTASLHDKPVQPEHLSDAEAGLKSELFDRRLRLNLAYYHYDYTNMQVTTLIEANGRTAAILQNAAAAKNDGFELEFEAQPTADLTLRGGLEAMHSRFASFPNATLSVPLATGGNTTVSGSAKGNQTPHSPDFTANLGGDYRVRTEVGDVLFSINYSYDGGFAWDADNRLKQAPYSLVNGSITWTSHDAAWDVRLWGKNLNGARYSTYTTANIVGDEESPAPPRTFGITVGRHF